MTAQTTSPKRFLGSAKSWLLAALGLVIAIWAVAVAVDYGTTAGRIHQGVTIAGVDVGSMTRGEAASTINTLVDKARRSPITLAGGGSTWMVMPDDVGTHFLVDRAVSRAFALSRYDDFLVDVATRFGLYFGSRDVELQGSVDDADLQGLADTIAAQLDQAPVDSTLLMENGTVKLVEGRNGRTVDQGSLERRLAALLLTLHSTTLDIPLTEIPPAIEAADNRAGLEKAETMLSGPVVLTAEDHAWTVTPAQMAEWMDFEFADAGEVSRLMPYLSEAKMGSFLDAIAPDCKTEPTSAHFANDGKKAWMVPGGDGWELDREATVAALSGAAASSTGRTVPVRLARIAPA